MYPLFSDTRGKDAMIDWQFKIMDYVYVLNVKSGVL